ncbi:MAG: 4-hydroxythreonine-4-phosphate dehydrogenase PdxA [Rhodospirillaceae bacterium]
MAGPQQSDHLPLALTMGEPAGVGGEISLGAWAGRTPDVPPFFLIDDPARLGAVTRTVGLAVPVIEIFEPEEAPAAFAKGLPVIAEPLAIPATPGKPQADNAPMVIRSIDRAVEFAVAGRAAAVVTNPINKAALYQIGFKHPGHTEYLAELTGGGRPVMMLACGALRTVPVSVHESLNSAIAHLTVERIVEDAEITHRALIRDFAVDAPRLAVAGLNPHAGEDGALGTEDQNIVRPAVEQLTAMGIDARGPVPPDSLFSPRARETYDAAICMYHDQALIPVKALDFEGGVNVTLGLPIIRTSPDHGTALDIAGTGQASPASLMAALRMAGWMALNRAQPS